MTNWQDLWSKQGQAFYESATSQLNALFENNKTVNPEQHTEQLTAWLNTLKSQWEKSAQQSNDKIFQNYWLLMAKICSEASDNMLREWTKRAKENDPIHNVRELYDLWLNCCNEKYQSAIQSKDFQDAYAEFMNAALKSWQKG